MPESSSSNPQVLTGALLDKILEQIERTEHLIDAIPPGSLDRVLPIDRCWPLGRLLVHLAGCIEGFCAVLYAACPGSLEHLAELRQLPALADDDPGAVQNRIRIFADAIRNGFAALEDDALAVRLPTVFDPGGQTVLALMLGNLEHLINHKHQLFTYLRWLRVEIGSADLYRFRTPHERR